MAKKKCPIFDHYPMFLPHFLSQKKEIKNGFRFCFFYHGHLPANN